MLNTYKINGIMLSLNYNVLENNVLVLKTLITAHIKIQTMFIAIGQMSFKVFLKYSQIKLGPKHSQHQIIIGDLHYFGDCIQS